MDRYLPSTRSHELRKLFNKTLRICAASRAQMLIYCRNSHAKVCFALDGSPN